MDVTFANSSVHKVCTNDKKRAKKFGHQRAREIKVALDELAAANDLSEIDTLPHRRLHLLKGCEAGNYSIDVDRQYRIWFRAPDREKLIDEDGRVAYEDVKAVEVYKIGDPHE